jgi:hypothetical protein
MGWWITVQHTDQVVRKYNDSYIVSKKGILQQNNCDTYNTVHQINNLLNKNQIKWQATKLKNQGITLKSNSHSKHANHAPSHLNYFQLDIIWVKQTINLLYNYPYIIHFFVNINVQKMHYFTLVYQNILILHNFLPSNIQTAHTFWIYQLQFFQYSIPDF